MDTWRGTGHLIKVPRRRRHATRDWTASSESLPYRCLAWPGWDGFRVPGLGHERSGSGNGHRRSGTLQLPEPGFLSYRIAINGWNGTGLCVAPTEQTCTWELEVTSGAESLNWTLDKTDLHIVVRVSEATLTTTNPTISWDLYPDAEHYEIILLQVEPTSETLEWNTLTSSSFTSSATLTVESRCQLLVWAWDATDQIAVGAVYLRIG